MLLRLEIAAELIEASRRSHRVFHFLQHRDQVLQILIIKRQNVQKCVVQKVTDIVTGVALPACQSCLHFLEAGPVHVGE